MTNPNDIDLNTPLYSESELRVIALEKVSSALLASFRQFFSDDIGEINVAIVAYSPETSDAFYMSSDRGVDELITALQKFKDEQVQLSTEDFVGRFSDGEAN